jgi:hypothetical protein
MGVVECVTLDGNKKVVQQDSLVLRPAVYALIEHNGKVLRRRTTVCTSTSMLSEDARVAG